MAETKEVDIATIPKEERDQVKDAENHRGVRLPTRVGTKNSPKRVSIRLVTNPRAAVRDPRTAPLILTDPTTGGEITKKRIQGGIRRKVKRIEAAPIQITENQNHIDNEFSTQQISWLVLTEIIFFFFSFLSTLYKFNNFFFVSTINFNFMFFFTVFKI